MEKKEQRPSGEKPEEMGNEWRFEGKRIEKMWKVNGERNDVEKAGKLQGSEEEKGENQFRLLKEETAIDRVSQFQVFYFREWMEIKELFRCGLCSSLTKELKII